MEVIVEDCENHPVCPHGPCLMFERKSADGKKTGRKFFACSACRDRSVCSFFHWVDDKLSLQKKEHWKLLIEEQKPPFSHREFMQRLSAFQNLPIPQRRYCRTCSLLILPQDGGHQGHELISSITSQQLLQPTSLFQSLQNNKAEAQYFFSESTVSCVVKLLSKLGFSKLLLIGTPKIYEYVVKEDRNLAISPLLLDIDQRYMQFFSPEKFCHYNLFNNHFFGGRPSKERVEEFLHEADGEKIAILVDPPFGGLIDAISYSLKTINEWWRQINSKEISENLPLLWFFPYFLEHRILKNFPDLQMMDYKVEYLNHKKFNKKINIKDSPVRIFTNIPTKSFALPKAEGYRFCQECQKFVYKENAHCTKCNSCTTKHGKVYQHCDKCQRCVKSSYIHCDTHNKCSPKMSFPSDTNKCACSPNQEDGNDDFERCYKCFGYGHRKRYCPTNKKNKKMKKQK